MRTVVFKTPFLIPSTHNTCQSDRYSQVKIHNTAGRSNIVETKDGFQIYVSVPGYGKTDINLELDNETLKVIGKVTTEENTKFNHQEFVVNSFERSFKLPKNLDASGTDAKVEAGMLSIYLPKQAELAPKSIEIK